MSELQHETNELRRKLRSSSASDVQQSPIAMLTVAAEMGVHGSSSGTDLPLTPQSHIVPPVSYHQRQTTPSNGGIEPSLTRMVGQIMPADYALDPTESRALDNIDLSGSEINELFELFVRSLVFCVRAVLTGYEGSSSSMPIFCPYWIHNQHPTPIIRSRHSYFGLSSV